MVAQARGVRFIADYWNGSLKELVPNDKGEEIAREALNDVATWLGFANYMQYNHESGDDGAAKARLERRRKQLKKVRAKR